MSEGDRKMSKLCRVGSCDYNENGICQMSDRDFEESLTFLIEQGVVKEVSKDRFALRDEYKAKYGVNLRKFIEENAKEPDGLALVQTLGEMVYPACFTACDIRVLAAVQSALLFRGRT